MSLGTPENSAIQKVAIIIIIINWREASSLLAAGECLSWGSSNSLPGGAAMTVCLGRNVTLAWFVSKAGAEHIVDIEWYFAANGQSTHRQDTIPYLRGY